jgi:uncharacterized protein YwqG
MQGDLLMEALRLVGIVVVVFVAVRTMIRRRRARNTPAPTRGVPTGSAEIVAELEKAAAADARPFVGWTIGELPPEGPTMSRLGGPVHRPADRPWPANPDGKPLVFLAQLDLAEAEPLPGWPGRGILQFFLGPDDLFGMNMDDLTAGTARVDFFDDPEQIRMAPPVAGPPLEDNRHPFGAFDRDRGLRLVSTEIRRMTPLQDSQPAEAILGKYAGHEDLALFENVFTPREGDIVPPLYSGGHAAFTQDDPRHTRPLAAYSRVVMQFGSDQDHLNWGDLGEAVFLIRPEDLAERRFERAIFSWDCY